MLRLKKDPISCGREALIKQARGLVRQRGFVRMKVVVPLIVVVLTVAAWMAYAWPSGNLPAVPARHSLYPPGVSITPTPEAVVGDLGGMAVTIPADFAHNVEYDGDPGFGEKRIGPTPPRTHRSGLRSLGFDVRYPEFEVTGMKERQVDMRKYTVFNTPWFLVGLTASSYFGDGLFLERNFAGRNRDLGFQYGKLAEKKYGMDAYTPVTVDVSKRNYNHETGTYTSDARDEDIFVHRSSEGKIDTLIRCSNRNHEAAVCKHFFYLDPKLRVEVSVQYRRGFLPNWQETQTAVTKLIYSSRAA